MTHPDPNTKFPIENFDRVTFLKNVIKRPNIIVGDYTYYYDAEDPANFEKNVHYHLPMIGDKLIIGKFCQIGQDATFLMNAGNHRYDGFSTFPFHAFEGWRDIPSFGGVKGDTVIGNDVWIGFNATIMPGITIHDGAIIGTKAVVTKDVPPYTIVAGNPAREIRKRFDEATIAYLLELQWWNWPIEKITQYAEALAKGDRAILKNV